MPIKRIHVSGVVQGVGFRPFVYQLATRLRLGGWVANTSAGVDVELEGEQAALDAFVAALTRDKPPLARIDAVEVRDAPATDHAVYSGFEIRASIPVPDAFQPISPDVSICPDCLRELFDPTDRRYLYPFINCTHCGPRFTIVNDIPYDRPLTTMRAFALCADCEREYNDPLDRRFHAQPIACPKCGPQVRLVARPSSGASDSEIVAPELQGVAAIRRARELLAGGAIVAVKGLGGFHLACDATNADAVRTLRERKGRVDKPFALMVYDLAAAQDICYVSETEAALLESRERPIVLLRRQPDSPVSDLVAPNNDYLGVMLPYTPLHYLLLAGSILVMTSGNISEEPLAIDNAEALERLGTLADYILLHDRDIATRVDDSVVRVVPEFSTPADRETSAVLPIRRSRGYAPYPVHLGFDSPPTLAVGAELKNTFCVTRERYAFISQHIGDLQNYPTLESFERQIEHFKHLFRVDPQVVAHDLHPDYLSTRYAQKLGAGSSNDGVLRSAAQHLAMHNKTPLLLVPVQHHHAHIASCMAENGMDGDAAVIGVAFDGTGYGTDGAIWGGEFLVALYSGFTRAAHLAYVPLPGGDAGIQRVYRGALAHLTHAGIEWDAALPCVAVTSEMERNAIRRQLETGLNAPLTSSMGRLFDAVAAIAGVRETINYEGQAAIELEHLVVENLEAAYEWPVDAGSGAWPLVIDPAPIIRAVVHDCRKQVPPWVIASRFHNAVARMTRDVVAAIGRREGLTRVALSGGVFQNVTVLTRTGALLRDAGFEVYSHHLVPPNDAGISLGQAAVAAHLRRQTNLLL